MLEIQAPTRPPKRDNSKSGIAVQPTNVSRYGGKINFEGSIHDYPVVFKRWENPGSMLSTKAIKPSNFSVSSDDNCPSVLR